jgi:diguanylate cyclase (GGDEF)-like protein
MRTALERRLIADLVRLRKKLRKEQEAVRELRAQLGRDELTGLLTRNPVEEEMRRIPLRDRRDPASTANALLMIDLDYFKAINDTFGHEAGNEVLREVARILTENTRRTDFVFRYGGEELGILFRNVNPAPHALGAKLEILRRAIESLRFDAYPKLRVTASFGYCVIEPHLLVSEHFRRADKAMYAAKDAGRNRIVDYAEIAAYDTPVT